MTRSRTRGRRSASAPAPRMPSRRAPARCATFLALAALAPDALADESVLLTSDVQAQITLRGGGGGGPDDPEDPLNCDEVYFPRADTYAIHQSFPNDSAQKEADRRYRTEVYFRAAVLETSSTIHGYWTSGLLHGVEFDWFFPAGSGTPPTPNRLGQAAAIYAPNGSGGTVLVAKMYCYDASQYAARKSAIEQGIGHVMDSYTVWADDVATSSGVGGERLVVGGAGNEVYGDCSSNSGAKVEGSGNAVIDGIDHVRPLNVHSSNTVAWDISVSAVSAISIPFTESAARTEAQQSGSYHSGDVVITTSNAPNDGVVFAEGNITVSGNALSGAWTFVSAQGTISFTASDLDLTPYQDHVVAVAFAGDVEVSGTRAEVFGELHAPSGIVDISADESRVHGLLAGDRVHVNGDNTVVTDGTDPQ